MRTFIVFLLLFGVAALASGALAYPAWWLVERFADVPIHRVMERVGMLVLAAVTIIFLRRRGLANKSALGYAVPRKQFVQQMLRGFTAGTILMVPLAVALFALQLRVWDTDFVAGTSPVLFFIGCVARGLLTGFAVAFIEETFCRGAMFTAIERESGLAMAIVLPTLFYAATHFLGGKLRIPADQVTYASGLQVAADLFERFAHPAVFVDTFIALAALGVLLALIRWRTGTIAGCIGLHAGGVTVIQTLHGISSGNPAAPMPYLVGHYDGVIGWLAAGWIAVVAAAYWRLSATRSEFA